MPMIEEKHIDVVISKLEQVMERYQSLIFEPVDTVQGRGWQTQEHLRLPPDENREWRVLQPGDVWGGMWQNRFRKRM